VKTTSCLAIPLYDTYIETPDEFNTPRATFAASIASINADLDKALTYLTVDDYKMQRLFLRDLNGLRTSLL